VGETLNGLEFKSFLIDVGNRVRNAKDELNSMDAVCGDGDFGSTMSKAFGTAAKALEATESDDVGVILSSAGNSILSSAGGACGPLFAAFFAEAGRIAKGKCEVGVEDLATMFGKACEKIQGLGGAVVGDKTMVDALAPAINALRTVARANRPLSVALEEAATASRLGCESTKGMVAKHGRARYLGEQTLGFDDPGAYLVSLIFATLARSTNAS
jgi:dihydroxyacetone kinase-like protein